MNRIVTRLHLPWGLSVVALVLSAAPIGGAVASDGMTWTTEVPVIDARPVVRLVRVPVHEEVCWEERVVVREPARRSPVPGIIGAVVGGVIGNQFGGGSGRDALTVAGAALGASVASNEQRRQFPDRVSEYTEPRCEWQRRFVDEERVVAWDVDYLYDGQRLTTRTDHEPGETITVAVSVAPTRH